MPAQKQKIFIICYNCSGFKLVKHGGTGEMIDCPICLGEGHIEWGYILVPQP